MPSAPEVIDPEVNVAVTCPRPKLVVVIEEVVAITGNTVSPPLEGLTIENATDTPPMGLLALSYTVASRVDEPVVVPTLIGTLVGVA
jgi:hypothetical protein